VLQDPDAELPMNAIDLRDLFQSDDFKQGLEEMSSYLASITQERPIVYLLAKCLWQQRYKFELEDKKHDLSLDGKRIEFKFNWDKCQKTLTEELAKCGDDLNKLPDAVQAGRIHKTRGVMYKIYKDVVDKKPDIFVWIICSRDLRKVAPDDLERICLWQEQRNYNAAYPYVSDGELLTVANSFLTKLRAIRAFTPLKQDIQTNGDFPSTYHFWICDFAS
jgi:hypothetical protein